MGLLDSLKGFGNDVVQKTGNMGNSIKYGQLIKDEEKKRNDLLLQIGQMYYQEFGSQATGRFKELCDQIAASEKISEEYNSEMSRLKGYINCPNCNAPVSGRANFCPSCGANISNFAPAFEKQPARPRGEICPKCGKESAQGMIFCTSCGTRLGGGDSAGPAVQDVERDVVSMGREVASDARQMGQDAAHNAGDMGRNIVHNAQAMTGNPAAAAKDMGINVAQDAKDMATDAANAAKDIGQDIVSHIKGTVETEPDS